MNYVYTRDDVKIQGYIMHKSWMMTRNKLLVKRENSNIVMFSPLM